jgi:tetratricopeptide (TPR) repeat protein
MSMQTRSKAPTGSSPRRHHFVIAVLCLLTFAAYSNSFSSGFVLDNARLLKEDPRVHDVSAENVGLILRHTYWWPDYETGLYRPLGTLSYLFNYSMLGNGENPEGYHWVNLLLHMGNVLLVYALARRLFPAFWPPVFIAGLWAVHPVLTESVTNIIGRVDLMAGMAVLSGLVFYLKSTEAHGKQRWWWLAALMAVTFLGVFSKENAVVILGLIVLYEVVWWRERTNVRGLLFGCAALAPPLLIMWYARSVVMSGTAPTRVFFLDNPLLAADFWTAKLTALTVLARYLGLLAWPANLSADYSYAQIPLARGSVGDWIAWSTLAAAIAAVILVRRHRAVLFAAGFAVISLAPTANLLFPIGTIMAERFLYLAAIGFIVCVVATFYALPRQPQAALCVIAAVLMIRTWTRNADWHDDLSLARATVVAAPASYRGHAMLAAALYRSHADIDAVIAESEKSLAILQPVAVQRTDALPYQQAGQFYVTKGDLLIERGTLTPAARQAYQQAWEVLKRCKAIVEANAARESDEARARGEVPVKPIRFAELYRLLSEVELRLGDTTAALEHALYALNLEPFSALAYLQWANGLLHTKGAEDAAVALMEGDIITKAPLLKEQLIQLYRNGLDTQRCAAVKNQGQWMLNQSCEVVRSHLCKALTGAERIYTEAGRADLAADTQEQASKLACRP